MARAARPPRVRPSAVLAAVLVCAQLAGAVGLPAVVRADRPFARCECASPAVCESGGCGCSAPTPVPEPVPDCCGCCGGTAVCAQKVAKKSCCAKPAGGTWRVAWIPGVEAAGCRKAGPLGTAKTEPAIPPTAPVRVAAVTSGEPVRPSPVRPSFVPAVPPDPPPRAA